ncbi:TnsA-like heteromeric transposase endonuclease subunit [Streptomyces sp. NPDC057499]|uniref:TnsA-like heteromeric transposase endonuclease subunit n=1 Tax=Streptomyces sp. NPDC057499 TaxID=3346150 RepID=UPI0036C3D563
MREVSADDVELEYVSAAGIRERESLGSLWPVRFESVRPEHRFPAFRGQGNWCGWYWSATCGGHVGYESWLERDRLMLLDFDPLVTGMASQPFQLSWAGAGAKRVRHTPDFFVRRADGTGLVVDVRPDERIGPDDAAKFAVTAAACRSVGWDFARVGTPEAVLMANVRWLAGYRHPRVHRPEVAARLMEVFADGGDLLVGAFPMQAPLRGTSRTWLSTTVEATARRSKPS